MASNYGSLSHHPPQHEDFAKSKWNGFKTGDCVTVEGRRGEVVSFVGGAAIVAFGREKLAVKKKLLVKVEKADGQS